MAREQLLTDTILKQQADQAAFEQRLSQLRHSMDQPASPSPSASLAASVSLPQSGWPSQPTEQSSDYALVTPPMCVNPRDYAHMYAYAAAAGMAMAAVGRGVGAPTTTATKPDTATGTTSQAKVNALAALGGYGSDAEEEED
jgi:hypothetical protein